MYEIALGKCSEADCKTKVAVEAKVKTEEEAKAKTERTQGQIKLSQKSKKSPKNSKTR